MKKIALVLLVAYLSVWLTACAAFLTQKRAADGQPLYRSKENPAEIVKESEIPVGQENLFEPYWDDKQPGVVPSLFQSILSVLGPWGTAAAGAIPMLTAIGAGLANRRSWKNVYDSSVASNEALAALLVHVMKIVDAIKNGELDTDDDGKVSMDEVKLFVAKQGKQYLKPEILEEVVRILNSGVSRDEMIAKVVDAAAPK